MADGPDEVEQPDPFSQLFLRALVPRGDAIAQFRVELRERRAARARAMATEVEAETGLPPEELLRRVLDDERATELFERALDAGTSTSFEAKRSLLAKALAHGLKDDADIDDTFVLVKAITELEVPHVRVLDQMVTVELTLQRAYPDQVIEGLFPGRVDLVGPLLATLTQVGVVIAQAVYGGMGYDVSPFGYRVISLLRGEHLERPEGIVTEVKLGPSEEDEADVRATVEQRNDPFNQRMDEVLIVKNRGPAIAGAVSFTFSDVKGEGPFIGEPFPVPELEADDDYEVPLHWSMGDPSPPYAAELTWQDGRGAQSRQLKLMPRSRSTA